MWLFQRKKMNYVGLTWRQSNPRRRWAFLHMCASLFVRTQAEQTRHHTVCPTLMIMSMIVILMSRRRMKVVNEKYDFFSQQKVMPDISPIPRDWGFWSISYFLCLPPTSGEVGKDDRKGVVRDLFGEFSSPIVPATKVWKGNDLEVCPFLNEYTKSIIWYLLISWRQQKQ